MASSREGPRVHLFVCHEEKVERECLRRQMLGDLPGNRGRVDYPRDMNQIAPSDYAVLWSLDHVRGAWTIVEAGVDIEPSAFAGMRPKQALVSLQGRSEVLKAYS